MDCIVRIHGIVVRHAASHVWVESSIPYRNNVLLLVVFVCRNVICNTTSWKFKFGGTLSHTPPTETLADTGHPTCYIQSDWSFRAVKECERDRRARFRSEQSGSLSVWGEAPHLLKPVGLRPSTWYNRVDDGRLGIRKQMREIDHRRAAFSLEESGLSVWGRSPIFINTALFTSVDMI